ncbi:MAG TPA: hypothetical protein VM096_20420 [Vicinamibacterales bacterium]|nr:hypothetical protein [Vicinamibacterales bacterium]
MLGVLGNAGIMALLSLLVCMFPLAAGLAYMLKPTEQRLALVRPISLAGLFSGLAGSTLGLINVLKMQWDQQPPPSFEITSVGIAESLVTMFVAFGCLTVTWLCVAIGMRRQS